MYLRDDYDLLSALDLDTEEEELDILELRRQLGADPRFEDNRK